jgi:pimeloyl-ACP methyl ester carboxylesterase
MMAELDLVHCPALVVGGAETDGDLATMREMAGRLAHGSYVEVPGAGHVVHWDNPAGWRAVVEPFVRALG